MKRYVAFWQSAAPENPAALEEIGKNTGHGSMGLFIIDPSGDDRSPSIEVPSGAWAAVLIVPEAGGKLSLCCRYPTGTEISLVEGMVQAGHDYKAWFHAEAKGDYEVWYNLYNRDRARSASVFFRVVDPKIEMDTLQRKMISAFRPAMSLTAAPENIGLSVGGAKDMGSFRENIKNGYLPLPSDVSYEGLVYGYFFDAKPSEGCDKIFCPSYSRAVSRDPTTGEAGLYISVGLSSGIKEFHRRTIDLVVVMDVSGSMNSPFNSYYYDRFGNRVETKEDTAKTKIDIANEAVSNMIDHLGDLDRLGIVIFSDDALILEPLTEIGRKDVPRLKDSVTKIKGFRGTNLDSGIERGEGLIRRRSNDKIEGRDGRMIIATDAMPNIGETKKVGLLETLKKNAIEGVYTTFIGIGVDFNTDLIHEITKVEGANYYSVVSSEEFMRRMDEEFDYMVTPLVFDLHLTLTGQGYRIERVYGSPEADLTTGDVMEVATLFPSKTNGTEVRGGVILLKLLKDLNCGPLDLRVQYRHRDGTYDEDISRIQIDEKTPDFYDNRSIRKAILLSRYADLLMAWILDERRVAKTRATFVALDREAARPLELGEWERQSMPLQVSGQYREIFKRFKEYFATEMKAIGDESLGREVEILKILSGS